MLGTIAAILQVVLEGRGVAVLPGYLMRRDLARRRADEPRGALFKALAATRLSRPRARPYARWT